MHGNEKKASDPLDMKVSIDVNSYDCLECNLRFLQVSLAIETYLQVLHFLFVLFCTFITTLSFNLLSILLSILIFTFRFYYKEMLLYSCVYVF